MTTLQVGAGQKYSTIAAAVNAANDGDTVNVQAGTYTNDFVSIYKNLTLTAVGGVVTMNATAQPPNGKAILTEGASGLTVNINGFAFTGATVPDGNGAGIRYEGGTLNIKNSHFYNNQDGILGAPDPKGVISISNSEFDHNGTGGGRTHNMYIGDIAQFTLTNSYTHDANVGHEIKSRAENNTITNNRILDNNSTSSYEIDLPNGGNAVITGNTIQQGARSQNQNIIAYGEEGSLHAGTSLVVTGNTIINDLGRGPALWNAGSGTAIFANNSVFGFGSTALVNGAANQSGTAVLASRPTLDTSAVNLTPTPVPSPTPVPAPAPPPALVPAPAPVPTTGLVLNISEDVYQGDAKYTVSVDGQVQGGVRTATALHSLGQTEHVAIGSLSAGPHRIGVTFLNDAYGGTPSTDRNLYIDAASYNGQVIPGASAPLHSAGTDSFGFNTGQSTSVTLPVSATTPVSGGTFGTGPDTLTVTLAEDAWQGDALATITIDGHTLTPSPVAVTALHAQGASETFTFNGAFGTGAHKVGVSFLNDAWGGNLSLDRNLYVDNVSLNGVRSPSLSSGPVEMYTNGTQMYAASGGTNITVPAVAASTTSSLTPTPTSGLVGTSSYSAAFAPNQYISAGQVLQYGSTQAWSALAEVEFDAPAPGIGPGLPQGGAELVFGNTNGAPYRGYELWEDDSGELRVRIMSDFIDGQYIDVAGSTNVGDGKMHFIGATYDGSGKASGITLYVDGKQEQSRVLSDSLSGSTVSNGPMVIGNQLNGWENQFNLQGHLAAFTLSDVDRPASYFQSGSPGAMTIDRNTQLAYNFAEGSGLTTKDLSGHGNTGTLSSTSIWSHV